MHTIPAQYRRGATVPCKSSSQTAIQT